MILSRIRNVALILGVSSLLAGCSLFGSSPPSHFYILAALPDSVAAGASEGVFNRGVGVGPVGVPEYLDRPQIVLRSGRNEVGLSELDKWAEPLEDGVLRVLGENLAKLFGTDRIRRYPWSTSSGLDYRISLRIERFDGEPGEDVMLVTRWRIRGGESRGRVLAEGHSRIEKPVQGMSHRSLVKAMSAAIGELSLELADTLRTLDADPTL